MDRLLSVCLLYLHLLLRSWWSQWDVVVVGQYHTCCCWKSPNMHVWSEWGCCGTLSNIVHVAIEGCRTLMSVTVVQLSLIFGSVLVPFSLFFRVRSPLTFICSYVVRSEISITFATESFFNISMLTIYSEYTEISGSLHKFLSFTLPDAQCPSKWWTARVQEAPMTALCAAKNNQNLLRKTSDSMS